MPVPLGSDTSTNVAPYSTWSIQVEPGDLLAHRFEVLRHLGSGGMGEVFEAQDRILDERVALKVIRSHQDGSTDDLLRLRREVQLARRVTHNNVCRIFDLIHHHDEGSGATLDLVSMELLEGETLRDRCLREGPLALHEALPIVRQIARGLNAAHRHGIVHRDLKPSNVMLVKESGGVRAAITDFGVAQRIGPDGSSDTASAERGCLRGTPTYMAPEQVGGEPTSPATDIYSLGVLRYELLSGRLPFEAKNGWQMMVRRLTEQPTPLEEHLPDLDPQAIALVDRCMKLAPEERFLSTGELLDALDFGDTGWNIYGHKAVSLDSTGALRREPMPSPEVVKLVETSSSAAREQIRQESEMLPPCTPYHRQLTVSVLALTMVLALATATLGGNTTIFSFLQKGEENQTERSFTIPKVDSAAQKALARTLAEMPSLAAGEVSTVAFALSSASEESEREAILERARDDLAAYDVASAQQILNDALSRQPQDPILLGALAESLWRAGREEDARAALARAHEQMKGLPREQALVFEGLRQGLNGAWHRARETYKTLWILHPNHLEYGLWILEANWFSGQVDLMPELFEALRSLPDGDGQDPRIDLWEARAFARAGDSVRRKELAHRVIAGAAGVEETGLWLEGQEELFRAHLGLSEVAEAEKVARELSRLAEKNGDLFLRAKALVLQGDLLNRQGLEVGSLAALEEADALFVELGSTYGRCLAHRAYGQLAILRDGRDLELLERGLRICKRGGFGFDESLLKHHLARALRDGGAFNRAVAMFRESARQMEELGNIDTIVNSQISLALLLGRMGRVAEMTEILGSTEEWSREHHNIERLTLILTASAEASVFAGRIGRAREFLAEAAALQPQGTQLLNYHVVRCQTLFELGDREKLRHAAAELRELATELQADHWIAEAHLFQALSLMLEEPAPENLERFANLDPLLSSQPLTEFHLRLGNLEAAAEAFEIFAREAQTSKVQQSLWKAEILSAQIDATANLNTSLERLRKVEGDALAFGFRTVAVESKIARGRLVADSRLLRQVANEARNEGLLRLAAEAERASGEGTMLLAAQPFLKSRNRASFSFWSVGE